VRKWGVIPFPPCSVNNRLRVGIYTA
jgi:hypothetical protein